MVSLDVHGWAGADRFTPGEPLALRLPFWTNGRLELSAPLPILLGSAHVGSRLSAIKARAQGRRSQELHDVARPPPSPEAVRPSSGALCQPRRHEHDCQRATSVSRGREVLDKVPEITLYFRIVKVLCTTVGETAGPKLKKLKKQARPDRHHLRQGALLLVALLVEFRSRSLGSWVSALLFGGLITAVAVAPRPLPARRRPLLLARLRPHPPPRRVDRRRARPGSR